MGKMFVEHRTPSIAARANREFSELQVAAGIEGPLTDTEQLHGLPVIGHIYTRPATESFDAKNSVCRFQSAVESGGSESNKLPKPDAVVNSP
jgi:hypothetical protein